MQRREFISFLGGAAATLPLAARAQQSDRVRRLGVLVASTADDPEWQTRIAAFQQGLLQLGWSDGRNVQIDTRWATTKPDDVRRHAAELAALAPDVIFAGSGTAAVAPLLQATRTVPIVFVLVIDPVGAGFVDSLQKPGGNATGFMLFEYSLSGKWLELLKQIAPTVTRAAVLRDPTIASGIGQFAAVHPYRLFVNDGGLISYGPDFLDQYRQAAGYVDRILKGDKPAEMPVQAPTKYEIVINLKTAKSIGLGMPPAVLARADEVLE
jgi:putative ABC transport system substrate-binding protein